MGIWIRLRVALLVVGKETFGRYRESTLWGAELYARPHVRLGVHLFGVQSYMIGHMLS